MSLNALHTASGLMIVFCFLAKIGIHAYIDFRHGRLDSLQTEVLFFLKYFKPYRAEVEPEFKVLKSACNFFGYLAIASLVINAAVGVLILLWFSFNPSLIRS